MVNVFLASVAEGISLFACSMVGASPAHGNLAQDAKSGRAREGQGSIAMAQTGTAESSIRPKCR